ncbi:MAG: WD40 repeat domain-containing protein, partial [Planctomycetota bacterium]
MKTPLNSFLLASCVVLGCLVVAPAFAQGKKPQENKQARPVGGAVALVQEGFSAPIVGCTVSKDGSVAVICTEDSFVHFTSLGDRLGGDVSKIGQNDNSFRYQIENAFLSPDGERLIGKINASTVAILTKKPQILHTLRGMPGLLFTALHADGIQFLAGMRGGLMRVWDTNSGKPLTYISVLMNKNVTWLGFTPDGNTMIAATDDKKLHYFKYPDVERQHEVETPGVITQLSFTADGSSMVSHAGKHVQVWDVGGAKVARSFSTGTPIVRTGISADGKLIAAAHEDGSVTLYDAATGKRRSGVEAHPLHQIICLQFIKPKNAKHLLVTAARKGDVVYWDVGML